jgi:ATP-dependent Lhr-like helicase
MNLSARLADEELRLRRALRKAWEGGKPEVERMLAAEWSVPTSIARRIALYVERQTKAAPIPVDRPVQLERIAEGRRTVLLLFHSVAGRAVNRSLAWVVAYRFAQAHDHPGVAANFDDHGFALSIDRKLNPEIAVLRDWFRPDGWRQDLEAALKSTETLGRKFRAVAEIGQLLPKRGLGTASARRSASWSGPLLYTTLMKHEPEHPLLREAVREVMEDQLDAGRAAVQARLIHESDWEVLDLPRPSPFAIPLFAFFHREVLLTQDPDKALEDAISHLYEEWHESATEQIRTTW